MDYQLLPFNIMTRTKQYLKFSTEFSFIRDTDKMKAKILLLEKYLMKWSTELIFTRVQDMCC